MKRATNDPRGVSWIALLEVVTCFYVVCISEFWSLLQSAGEFGLFSQNQFTCFSSAPTECAEVTGLSSLCVWAWLYGTALSHSEDWQHGSCSTSFFLMIKCFYWVQPSPVTLWVCGLTGNPLNFYPSSSSPISFAEWSPLLSSLVSFSVTAPHPCRGRGGEVFWIPPHIWKPSSSSAFASPSPFCPIALCCNVNSPIIILLPKAPHTGWCVCVSERGLFIKVLTSIRTEAPFYYLTVLHFTLNFWFDTCPVAQYI